jgi:tetratricopeptide (TPR) repeat protein
MLPGVFKLLCCFIFSIKTCPTDSQTVRSDIFRVEAPSEAAARRLFYKATDDFNAARWDEALEHFQKAYEITSHYRGSALFNAGLIIERTGDAEDAARLFWSAAKANDGVSSVALTRIGLIFGRSGETKRALEAFDTAIKEDKENVMAKRNRIVALRNLGSTGKCIHFSVRKFPVSGTIHS